MDRRPLLVLTAALWLLGLLAWLVTVLFSLQASSTEAVALTRTVATLVVVLLTTRSVVRRSVAGPGLERAVVAAAVLSYALFPPAWGGHALVAQLVVGPAWAAALLDGVVWVAVVVGASRTVQPRAAATRAPYQAW